MGDGRMTPERRLSTTAVKTGMLWTDGSEVMRKVIDQAEATTFLTTAGTNIAHGISSPTWIKVEGFAYDGSDVVPLPHVQVLTAIVETAGDGEVVTAVTYSVDATNITSVTINESELPAFTDHGVRFILEYV